MVTVAKFALRAISRLLRRRIGVVAGGGQLCDEYVLFAAVLGAEG
jgi:hypothetical protein